MRDPGQYDKRMILMQPGLSAPSASGEQTQVGVEIARMWCKLDPAQGREYQAAGQVRAESAHTILTPYRSDVAIDSTMWLLYGSRRFDVESVVNADEANEEFVITAREH